MASFTNLLALIAIIKNIEVVKIQEAGEKVEPEKT